MSKLNKYIFWNLNRVHLISTALNISIVVVGNPKTTVLNIFIVIVFAHPVIVILNCSHIYLWPKWLLIMEQNKNNFENICSWCFIFFEHRILRFYRHAFNIYENVFKREPRSVTFTYINRSYLMSNLVCVYRNPVYDQTKICMLQILTMCFSKFYSFTAFQIVFY